MGSNPKWYMQQGVRVPKHISGAIIPGRPRREVAQEFYTNVLELGKLARERYLDECKCGARAFVQAEIDELDENVKIIQAELAKFK